MEEEMLFLIRWSRSSRHENEGEEAIQRWRESFPSRGDGRCKGLGVDMSLVCRKNGKQAGVKKAGSRRQEVI